MQRSHRVRLDTMTAAPTKTGKFTTLKEVAAAAGVSPMTISNYVNGRHDLMSAEVRERVSDAVARLNYRSNNAARNLRKSQILSIGMIIVDNSPVYLADGYTTQIVAGVSNYLTEHGYSLLLQGIRPNDFEKSRLIRDLQTDGLFVMLSGENSVRHTQFDTLRRLGQPLVIFMESFDGNNDFVCAIKQDEFAAGSMIAEHVMIRQPKSAVILVPQLNIWAAVLERERGMRAVLEPSLGVDGVSTLACSDGGFDDVQSAMFARFKDVGLPDAVLCINDQMAIAAVKSIRAVGAQVPLDVQVTGFNAFDYHRYAEPELTTMRSFAYDMGVCGAKEMLNRLHRGKFDQQEIVFPFEFIRGEST